MKLAPCFIIGVLAAFVAGGELRAAALVVIDDFETDVGHFDRPPSFSGSSQGETETAPGTGPSTATHDTTEALPGTAGSLRVFIDDDPFIDGTDGSAWRIRLLSGTGTITNNEPLQATGWVGYWMKTTTPNLQASLFIDDSPAALERALFLDVIPDNEWHLYEWNFDDEFFWEPFALSETNGTIDSDTVTIDGIYLRAFRDFGLEDQDAVVFIDNVSADPEGNITIPEPSAAILLLVGGLGLARRRRRNS